MGLGLVIALCSAARGQHIYSPPPHTYAYTHIHMPREVHKSEPRTAVMREVGEMSGSCWGRAEGGGVARGRHIYIGATLYMCMHMHMYMCMHIHTYHITYI